MMRDFVQTLPQTLMSFTAAEQGQLEALVMANEGFKQFPYNDATGQPIHIPQGKITVGYGFNLTDVGLSLSESLCILRSRLCYVESQLRFLAALDFSHQGQYRKMALIDMAYNMGMGTFLKFTQFIGYMRGQQYANAVNDLMKTPWFTQVRVRSARDTNLIQNNVWSAL